MFLQTPAAHLTLGDFVNNQLKFSDLFDFGVFYCDLQANCTTNIKSSYKSLFGWEECIVAGLAVDLMEREPAYVSNLEVCARLKSCLTDVSNIELYQEAVDQLKKRKLTLVTYDSNSTSSIQISGSNKEPTLTPRSI